MSSPGEQGSPIAIDAASSQDPPLALPAPLPANPRRLPPPCWSHDETIALIDAYRDKWYALRRGNLKANHWQEVADDVGRRCPGASPLKTAVQCRHKMEKLRKRYRTETQKARSMPVSRFSSSWVHFKRMDSMEKGPQQQQPLCSGGEGAVGDDDDDDLDLDLINPHSLNNTAAAAAGGGGNGVLYGGGATTTTTTTSTSTSTRSVAHKLYYNNSNSNSNSSANNNNNNNNNRNGMDGLSASAPAGAFRIRIPTGVSIAQPAPPPPPPLPSSHKFYTKANLATPTSSFNPNSKGNYGMGPTRGAGEDLRKKRDRDPMEDMVAAIKFLGDGFVRMEHMKMEMAREMETMRMEMEMKRTHMILDSHQRIVEAFAKAAFSNNNKKKKQQQQQKDHPP